MILIHIRYIKTILNAIFEDLNVEDLEEKPVLENQSWNCGCSMPKPFDE